LKAVVLAAGEGVRLQPITLTRPKHLIKVGGKPILEHCLRALKSCGIDEIVLVVHYMAGAIRDYFGDGQSLGLKVEYVEQKEVLGTGNAVGIVESFVGDDFLLVYGDLLFTVEAVKKVVGLYEKEKPIVAMAVVPVENPEGYGIVEVDDDGYVKRIVEKPSREEAVSNLANAGMYVFSKEIFGKVRETSASVRGEWEVTDAISLLLREGKRVLAVEVLREDWFDVGTPWDLLEANRWVLLRMDHKVYGIVENGARLVGAVTVAESARVRSGAYVEGPVFIGEGSDVGPNCYVRAFTSVGEGVRVGNGCEVKNCLVMDGVHVGHLSYIGDSVIGEGCNLGAGTVTANLRLDDGSVKMLVKGVVVDSGRRKLGVVLGDGVKSGIGALFMPGVKVGCNSWIGPNVVVCRDVGSDRLVILKQDLEEKELDR
jgi:UDP-N-acetylglucosamine diphosphorylase/glucosamine-1-phosphate N-acetyltransferase